MTTMIECLNAAGEYGPLLLIQRQKVSGINGLLGHQTTPLSEYQTMAGSALMCFCTA